MAGIGPGYERPRPPQSRGFYEHVRDDGPANTGRVSGSALLITMATVVAAVVALVFFVFLR